jgi:ferredoxin, 2Fe-2S
MPQVNFVVHGDTVVVLDLECGQSLIEGATRNGVPGILAECGGACMCATCHVYVESGGRTSFRPLARRKTRC